MAYYKFSLTKKQTGEGQEDTFRALFTELMLAEKTDVRKGSFLFEPSENYPQFNRYFYLFIEPQSSYLFEPLIFLTKAVECSKPEEDVVLCIGNQVSYESHEFNEENL